MKLLLDTHAALWFLSGDQRMGQSPRRHLTNSANHVLLSAAVVWEVAIKRSLGQLVAPDEYLSLLLDAGAQPLSVSLDHAAAAERLPWHHRDPFDRILIAQATLEGAALVSHDAALEAYGVQVLW